MLNNSCFNSDEDTEQLWLLLSEDKKKQLSPRVSKYPTCRIILVCISEISTAVTALCEILHKVRVLWHEVKLQAVTSCPVLSFMSRLFPA